MNPVIKKYTSEPELKNPIVLFRSMLSDMIQSRELALQLAVRDLKALYRQSFIGYYWLLILPVFNTLTWLFLRNTGIVKMEDTGMPYEVYIFSGSMIWQIFSESIQSPLKELSSGKGMMTKLNFPKEALITSGIIKVLVNSIVKIGILVPFVMYFGAWPDWQLLLFPLGLISLVLVGTAIGLFLAPIGILYDDITKGLPIILQFAMYLTPVVFVIPQVGWTKLLIEWNPLTPLIMNTRIWLTGGDTIWPLYTIGVVIFFLLLLLFSWVFFRVTLVRIIERMSA